MLWCVSNYYTMVASWTWWLLITTSTLSLLGVHALQLASSLPTAHYHHYPPHPNNCIIPRPRPRPSRILLLLLESHCSPLPPSSSSSYSSSSLNLFGTKHKTRRWSRRWQSSVADDNSSSGSNAVDAGVVVVVNPSSNNSSSSSSTTLLKALDSFGMKLKPWAVSANTKSVTYYTKTTTGSSFNRTPPAATTTTTTTTTSDDDDDTRMTPTIMTGNIKSILHKLQAIVLWVLYIIYRGYRGFFVLLPAVFREVYRQLETSDLVLDVYGDDDEVLAVIIPTTIINEGGDEDDRTKQQLQQQQQQHRESMKLRTRITISILSMMVTLSYVISGALRVLGKRDIYDR